MNYKLKYHDNCVAIDYDMFWFRSYVLEKEMFYEWEDGFNWYPEPNDNYVKQKTIQSKLLRTLFL